MSGDTTTPDQLGDLGLRDPDQPTQQAHEAYMAPRLAEFTPTERHAIRVALGMLPEEDA